MNRHRSALLAVMVAALGTGSAPPPLTPASSVDEVLDAMQARSADLTSFTAGVTQTQVDVQSDTTVLYKGTVTFQFLPTTAGGGGGGANMHLTLNTKQIGTAAPIAAKKEYLLAGGWLTDRDYPTKTETVRQVVRPGQTVNLFQLGKGPFPLPIGQSRASVEAQFDVRKLPPAKGDPAGAIHLQLTPKKGSSFERQFLTVDFWVDAKQRLPVRVETLDRGGTSDQTNDLTGVTVNGPVGPAEFTLTPLPTAAVAGQRAWTTNTIPLPAPPTP